MIPYASKYFPPEDLAVFNEIQRAVKSLPDDLKLGVDEDKKPVVLSCHMLARAVGKVFDLEIRDGSYIGPFDHSWLMTPSKWHIIDVYPVGMLGGPIAVDAKDQLSPGQRLYITKSTNWISGGRFSKPSFRRSVYRLTQLLVAASVRSHGTAAP